MRTNRRRGSGDPPYKATLEKASVPPRFASFEATTVRNGLVYIRRSALAGSPGPKPGSGPGTPAWTMIQTALAFPSFERARIPRHRNPRLLLWFSGSFLLRFDARRFAGLLFQDPPRSFWLRSHGARPRRAIVPKKFPCGYAARKKKQKRKGKRKKAQGN